MYLSKIGFFKEKEDLLRKNLEEYLDFLFLLKKINIRTQAEIKQKNQSRCRFFAQKKKARKQQLLRRMYLEPNGRTAAKEWQLFFLLYLPIKMKMAANRATMPTSTLGIATPGAKAEIATRIK